MVLESSSRAGTSGNAVAARQELLSEYHFEATSTPHMRADTFHFDFRGAREHISRLAKILGHNRKIPLFGRSRHETV
jgi:hypothetical protein